LVERGSRSLLVLADQGGKIEMQDRTAGFVEGLAEHGLVPKILSCTSYYTVVCEYVREHLGELRKCDGVFCHTDLMACATLSVLRAAGIRVPEEVKVIGYDDIEVGTYFSPRLTTIHQPREAIAEQSVRDLVLRMGRKETLPATSVSIAPWLVVREST
jgi:LacI family transcriptional regulator